MRKKMILYVTSYQRQWKYEKLFLKIRLGTAKVRMENDCMDMKRDMKLERIIGYKEFLLLFPYK